MKHLFTEKAIQLVMIFAFLTVLKQGKIFWKDLFKLWNYLFGILNAFQILKKGTNLNLTGYEVRTELTGNLLLKQL